MILHSRSALRSRLLLAWALTAGLALAGCAVKPPVSVGSRPSRLGQGIVFEITNVSDRDLNEVRVTIESPDGDEMEYGAVTLKPRETLEVGWLKLEGWAVPPGSTATVRADGYLLPSGPWASPE